MKLLLGLFKKIVVIFVVIILLLFLIPNFHGGGTWGTNFVGSQVREVKRYFSQEGKEERKKDQEQEQLREKKEQQIRAEFFREYEHNNNVKCTLNTTGGYDCK